MRNRVKISIALSALLFLGTSPPSSAEPSTTSLLATIKAIGPEGKGNVEAAEAWKQLVQKGTSALLPTLAAMDDADARTLNWLRAAVNAIGENAIQNKRKLPVDRLDQFIIDQEHSGPSRYLAYELLTQVDPKAADRHLPKMIDDPSGGLRRTAIARALKEAQELLDDDKKAQAKRKYEDLFAAVRDEDQVGIITKKLKSLGVAVDLPAHFGFVQEWHLTAPFDNRNGVGYDKVYPPEKGVDLSATYTGQDGKKIRWKAHKSTYALPEMADKIDVGNVALIDLNTVIDKHKGAVAFAHTVIDSPKEQQIQVRASCITAIKIYVNGKLVHSRNEYHHGMRFDQHVASAALKKGRNQILLKICQNEQTEMWAQRWAFQFRLCDDIGGAVPFAVVSSTTEEENKGGAK